VWFLLIGAAVVALAHTAPFPFVLEAFDPARSMWEGPKTGAAPAAYLTFDDGPNPEATPALLDVLAREGARATFFLIPEFVTAETAPIVRRAAADGHGLALHSNTRALMLAAPTALAARLAAQADAIEALTGARPCRLFRPHAGWRGGEMYAGLARAGYTLTGWGFALWDFNWWRRRDPDRIAARLARRISDGSIVVMHDGHHQNPRADRRHTVATTAALVPQLRGRGFTLRSLCPPVS
jgi:peptidoglycan/xylan/chitin deacetylase (PgdA/CDA1 family)